jgi:hypothetical protein
MSEIGHFVIQHTVVTGGKQSLLNINGWIIDFFYETAHFLSTERVKKLKITCLFISSE